MAVLIYIYLIIIMRITGKRTLLQYNMFESIITIAFGSTIATILLTKALSFVEGALALGSLTFIQFMIGFLERKSGAFKKAITPTPKCMYEDGVYNEEAMRKERVMKEEIRTAVREKGVGSMDLVKVVVLEGNGKLSIITKQQAGSLDVLEDVKH